MGRQIGYIAYKLEDGKLVDANLSDIEDNELWCSGRDEITDEWCKLFYSHPEYVRSFKSNVEDVIVEFVMDRPDLDNYIKKKTDSYKVILKNVSYEKFAGSIRNYCNKYLNENIAYYKKELDEYTEKKAHYEELQTKSANRDVFDAYEEKINSCIEYINESKQALGIDASNEYGDEWRWHADRVLRMLDKTKELMNDGYVLVAYISD